MKLVFNCSVAKHFILKTEVFKPDSCFGEDGRKKPVKLAKDIRQKMETKISMSLEKLILNRSALSCCLSPEILIFFAAFVVAFGLTSHNSANP